MPIIVLAFRNNETPELDAQSANMVSDLRLGQCGYGPLTEFEMLESLFNHEFAWNIGFDAHARGLIPLRATN